MSLTTLAIAFGACLLVYLVFLGALLIAGRRRDGDRLRAA